MVFAHRNWEHDRLRRKIYLDSEKYNYNIQPIGHEHLKTPVPHHLIDDTSWSIRATPDDLILYKRSTILEVKAKLNDRPNLSVELKPLEIYKKKSEEIFVAFETVLRGGLDSVMVQAVDDISIETILIPDRNDNIGKYDELINIYPDAHITDKVIVLGGSGTPFVLIEPNVFNKWLSWGEFRNKIILEKRCGQILLDEFLD